jgi:hypothetical protein
MAYSVELALQKIFFREIGTALPTVTASTQPVHTQPLPYIQFGQTDVVDFPAGHELTAEIHTWEKAMGPDGLKTKMQAIRDALHGKANTIQDGWSFTALREVSGDVIIDEDGETWHGIQRFRCFACS